MVARPLHFTETEYLALEAVAEIRHEYTGGDIVGMAGAEPDHNQIAQNVRVALDNTLRPRGCRVLGSDQRVKVEATAEYFYPDVVVTCFDPIHADPSPRSLLNPQIIVEVLSPTTELRDRGPKWLAYQSIPTLTDYVLIATGRRRVEHYRRTEGGWLLRVHEEGTAELSNGAKLELETIYQFVDR